MEARFNERIRELQSDPDKMYEYIAQCIPYIAEYTEKIEVQTSSLFSSKRGGVKRKDIFDNYLQNVEGKSTDKPAPRSSLFRTCTCGSTSFIADSAQSDEICTQCGRADYILGEEMGFKEEQEMEKNVNYSYKRDNHLNEWIAQFQAKESTTVPPDVINLIRAEFKKRRIKDVSEITNSKVKEVLKKLRLNKYYEHSPYIATILNGIQPPTMTQALEDRLRLMFNQVQAPFERHCPADRKNFLSYSYVLYKFCELLSEDEYLPCFPLLKSKEKLYKQDQIWKNICSDLKWEYIPTV
jgi:hypothetical protein